MWLNQFTSSFEKKITAVTRSINTLGVASLGLMMMVTAVDVVSRFFFNLPIPGSIEITGIFLLLTVLLGIPYAAARRQHVSIEMLIDKVPENPRWYMANISQIVAIVMFCVVIWQTLKYFEKLRSMGAETPILLITLWPFVLVTALAFVLLVIVLSGEMVARLHKGFRNAKQLALLLILAVAFLFFFYWIAFDARALTYRLPPLTVGVIGMFVLFLVFLCGLPIFYSLLLVGFLGMAYLRGSGAGLSILGSSLFTMGMEYHFSVIPLFILMGEFCFYSKIGEDLYQMAYRWLGFLPGGLAIGTIGGCGGFAAVCGDSLATAVTMGTVVLPEMRKYNYHPGFAAGCVAAGGTLGVLIPPSLAFILYALLTDQSIAVLFMAGILPGILLISLFMGGIYLMALKNPALGPAGPKFAFAERMDSLKSIWAILLLIALVIGGMYGGIFTPTEGGGIGAFGAMLIGVLRRRLYLHAVWSSILEASRISAVCMGILFGATIFGYFMAASKLPIELASYVAGLSVPPLLILIIILLIYILLGCIMPAIPMLVLTVPIFFPVITTLGFDPIWYGVIMVLMFELAVITPPMGINILALKTVATDIELQVMFRGVLPFVLMMVSCIAIMIAFPDIALFLPRFFGK
jgi:tripartite ATP-independent transporter DctM subunit